MIFRHIITNPTKKSSRQRGTTLQPPIGLFHLPPSIAVEIRVSASTPHTRCQISRTLKSWIRPVVLMALWALVTVTILFSSLHAFPPRSEKDFSNNALVLLKKGQYSALEDYFKTYFPELKKPVSKRARQKYLSKIFSELPNTASKKKLLSLILSTNYRIPIAHCWLAEIFYLERQWAEATRYYENCPGRRKYFFLAKILSREFLENLEPKILNPGASTTTADDARPASQKKAQQAISHYKKALLVRDKNLRQEVYRSLSELYRVMGQPKIALGYAKKMTNGISKSIELYFIYQSLGREEDANRLRAIIIAEYGDTLEGRSFINQVLMPVEQKGAQ